MGLVYLKYLLEAIIIRAIRVIIRSHLNLVMAELDFIITFFIIHLQLEAGLQLVLSQVELLICFIDFINPILAIIIILLARILEALDTRLWVVEQFPYFK